MEKEQLSDPLKCKLERRPELTPDVPRVDETHKSHTMCLFTPPWLDGRRECDQSCCELSWTQVDAKINTTNERGKRGRHFYFMVQAKHILTMKNSYFSRYFETGYKYIRTLLQLHMQVLGCRMFANLKIYSCFSNLTHAAALDSCHSDNFSYFYHALECESRYGVEYRCLFFSNQAKLSPVWW